MSTYAMRNAQERETLPGLYNRLPKMTLASNIAAEPPLGVRRRSPNTTSNSVVLLFLGVIPAQLMSLLNRFSFISSCCFIVEQFRRKTRKLFNCELCFTWSFAQFLSAKWNQKRKKKIGAFNYQFYANNYAKFSRNFY